MTRGDCYTQVSQTSATQTVRISKLIILFTEIPTAMQYRFELSHLAQTHDQYPKFANKIKKTRGDPRHVKIRERH